ncbi:Hypothetical Protein FCC1311_108612 [Hondaea fermentalgiana]|uniref:Uncharacterized protein n=1 Tax=Hondaea fermentalgiana TaxID=2315210 RepID=A0A2R5GWC8_9STRA|nr:Hypothetical Protein FCC1311_108612 [Hondaea fermentalgiana]|eukprot:GBG34639.1 Hypothetical Protein FCC1311_108612 [Hondaea fermentalgiana]
MRGAWRAAAAAAAESWQAGARLERRRPLGLAGVRGAKYKRVNRQEQIAQKVRYEKRQKLVQQRALEAEQGAEEDELPKYVADKIRKSQRGPGNVRLGRQDLRMGLTELDLMNLEDADDTIAARVKMHHRDLLRKGIPKARGASPRSVTRRQQRAETRIEQHVQEAFVNREIGLVNAVTSRLVGFGAFSTVECVRAKISGDMHNVTIVWRPPLHHDLSPLAPEEVELVAEAMRRCTPQIRAIVAKRVQHHRAPHVMIEMEEARPGLDPEEQVALKAILAKERASVAATVPDFRNEEESSFAEAASTTANARQLEETLGTLSPLEERLVEVARATNPSISDAELAAILLDSRADVAEARRAHDSSADSPTLKAADDNEAHALAQAMLEPLSRAEEALLEEAMETYPDMDEAVLRKLLLESREEVFGENGLPDGQFRGPDSEVAEREWKTFDINQFAADDDDDREDLRAVDPSNVLPSEGELPPEFQSIMQELRSSLGDMDEELVQEVLRELQEEAVKNGPPSKGGDGRNSGTGVGNPSSN